LVLGAVINVHVVLMVAVIVIASLLAATVDGHSIVCCACSWMASSLIGLIVVLVAVKWRWLALVLLLILVRISILQRRMRWSSVAAVDNIIVRLNWFILKVHGIVCLIVQESLPLKKILASLECTLLLHLLKAILVWLQDVLSWIIIVRKLIEVLIHVFNVWTLRSFVLVASGWVIAITWRTSVSKRNTVDVVANYGHSSFAVMFLTARSWSSCWVATHHHVSHISTVSNWRRTVSMNWVPLRTFIFSVHVAIGLEFIDKSLNLRNKIKLKHKK